MLPIYFMYLAGTSENRAGSPSADNNHLLPNSIGFVTGFSIVFILLGAAAAMLGNFLDSNREILQRISGVIMVLFGLNFTGILKIGILNTEKRFRFNINRMRFPGSVLFGMVFGFGWSPCLGSFLGSALALAGSSETVTEGMIMLMVYSVGLAIPFVVSALVFEKVRGVFAWLQRNSRVISIISGLLLITAGILVFFDILKYLL